MHMRLMARWGCCMMSGERPARNCCSSIMTQVALGRSTGPGRQINVMVMIARDDGSVSEGRIGRAEKQSLSPPDSPTPPAPSLAVWMDGMMGWIDEPLGCSRVYFSALFIFFHLCDVAIGVRLPTA